jgi:hypothetical protein
MKTVFHRLGRQVLKSGTLRSAKKTLIPEMEMLANVQWACDGCEARSPVTTHYRSLPEKKNKQPETIFA